MWSVQEFSQGLDEFHYMNKASLSRAADMILNNAGQSFSRILGNSFRQTVAGIFSKAKMTSAKMLEGNIKASIDRCKSSASDHIIVAQDTTYYNYRGHHKMDGLGQIQGSVKGIIQHNALAIDSQGVPLGLIYQHNWTRKGAIPFEGKESKKWFDGLQAVNQHLGGLDKSIVLVQDREADIFDFFNAKRADNVELLVRVSKERQLEAPDKQQMSRLIKDMDHIPKLGEYKVKIRRKNREVELTLSIQSRPLNLVGGKNKSKNIKGLHVVVAKEIAAIDKKGRDCFEAEQAACWILLTSLEVSNLEQACMVVRFYAMRWTVERLHYVLKSGALNVERLQFDDVQSTMNALSFYSIIAWRILYLNIAVRQNKEDDPGIYFTGLEMKVLKSRYPKADQSLGEAIKALGKLVNFVPSSAQPYPGVKVMAEALAKLNDITEAIKLMYEDPLQD